MSGNGRESRVRSIAFFNNKSRIGKTTLACNVTAQLAARMGKRVLLVDGDPQCDATQLVLDQARCEEIYNSVKKSRQKTLLDVLQPIRDGDDEIDPSPEPISAASNRFGVDLMPCHPRMALVETLLERAWDQMLSGDVRGLRISSWAYQFCQSIQDDYDVLVFDLGSNLGPLNRSILLGADYFVTPTGCDILSIVSIRNVSEWLATWLTEYANGLKSWRDRQPDAMANGGFRGYESSQKAFAGYIVQQDVTRGNKRVPGLDEGGQRIGEDVPRVIKQSLGEFLAPGLDLSRAKLGDVPNVFSLMALAQSVNAPVLDLQSEDTLVGSQYIRQRDYASTIQSCTERLAANVALFSRPVVAKSGS